MWVPETGYLSQFKYVETAHYWEGDEKHKPGPVRSMRDEKPILVDVKDVYKYQKKYNNTGIYTSIFQYNNQDIDIADSFSTLYFDLDNNDLELAQQETIKLAEYLWELTEHVNVYFSGRKGFHIVVEPVAFGISPIKNMAEIIRYIGMSLINELDLKTIDTAVWEQRRIWRLPNSRHENTLLYKVFLPKEILYQSVDKIKEYAQKPQATEQVIPQFSYKANQWYREWIYKQEEQKTISIEERIARFNKYGTSIVKKMDGDLEFDPERLFTNCTALADLWTKSETQHDLSHEERLFLCSILSYTDEAVQYLHAILSQTDDYSFEISQAHIDDWMRRRENNRGGRPYTCQRARSVGIMCNGCDKLEPKPKLEVIGDQVIEMNELAQPSPIRYGYFRKR